jgi:3-methyladenine DNA glycosylase/8-oxoguanine DNA glycosylase
MMRRHPGLRIPRTGLVFEALVPTVLEQKVTGVEARRAWRYLVRRVGSPAPGPAPPGMRVVPDAPTWARIPSWEWHRAGVDAKRSATIVRAAHVAGRLEEMVDLPPASARARLPLVAGVGPWTAAEVAQRALGDADAVTVGDLHLPRLVGWALAGRPFDDAAMLAALATYAPHRHRAVRFVELAGLGKPRFAPRYSIRDFRWM